MTESEQNAFIARLVGRHRTRLKDGVRHYAGPNYINDLEEMHKAEKALGIHQHEEYGKLLDELMVEAQEDVGEFAHTWMHFPSWHASAAIRAEALAIVMSP